MSCHPRATTARYFQTSFPFSKPVGLIGRRSPSTRTSSSISAWMLSTCSIASTQATQTTTTSSVRASSATWRLVQHLVNLNSVLNYSSDSAEEASCGYIALYSICGGVAGEGDDPHLFPFTLAVGSPAPGKNEKSSDTQYRLTRGEGVA